MTKTLQRTLLVSLGQTGAQTVERLLAGLDRQVIESGLIQGLAVAAGETPLTVGQFRLEVSPEAPFETWRPEFERQAGQALRAVSRLENAARLARLGLAAHRLDEIHLVIVANAAEAWISACLPSLVDAVSRLVDRTLACPAGFTGVLYFIDDGEAAPAGVEDAAGRLEERLACPFDRGCFLAGLANEAGLIAGSLGQLVEATAAFLVLYLQEPALAAPDWDSSFAAPGRCGPLASFGFARMRWPGSGLAEALSARWSRELLEQLDTLPAGRAPVNPARQAQQAVQQWLAGEKLAPSLLLERLASTAPAPVHSLADLAPDPPWPWLLAQTPARLERAGQRWQEGWLKQRGGEMERILAGLLAAWPEQAGQWLQRQLAGETIGAMVTAQATLATATDLLLAFVEGVEQKLAEAEEDLARADGRLSRAAGDLAAACRDLPGSPARTLLSWGLRPDRWLSGWARCRQVQAGLRDYAHLVRARWLAWQAASFYELMLPFYRQLLVEWRQVAKSWEQGCRQAGEAGRQLQAADWAGRISASLAGANGPWDESLVENLYRETVETYGPAVWQETGTLAGWIAAGLDAQAIADRLRGWTIRALAGIADMPVDRALARCLPDEIAQAGWLAGLAEQARPFWRFDETCLAEAARAQVRLDRWLLLPRGEASPLAPLARDWPQPPRVLAGDSPAELAVVTVRRLG